MSKSLSFDMRCRVQVAVVAGLFCHRAMAHFGLSAIRGVALRRDGRHARPKQKGGDRFSRRTEAHAALIRAALDEVPDLTVPRLRARLAEQGALVGVTALWRFCHCRRITRRAVMQLLAAAMTLRVDKDLKLERRRSHARRKQRLDRVPSVRGVVTRHSLTCPVRRPEQKAARGDDCAHRRPPDKSGRLKKTELKIAEKDRVVIAY